MIIGNSGVRKQRLRPGGAMEGVGSKIAALACIPWSSCRAGF